METITNNIDDIFDNSLTPEEILQLDYDQLFYNIFRSIFTKIDEIIKNHPHMIETIKELSSTKKLIKYNNFSEKLACSYTLTTLMLIIITSYKNLNEKEDENDDESYYEDYELIEVDDIPLLQACSAAAFGPPWRDM